MAVQDFTVMGHEILVPAGRILYRPLEQPLYLMVRHPALGLWVTEDGWTVRSPAAGPFHPNDALRALRLANTRVPQGCELGPWQSGLELFAPSSLPAHPNDWQRVEQDWLPPSVSRYSRIDLDQVVNETCCAPPVDRPRVNFRGSSPPLAEDVRERIQAQWPELSPLFGGALLRPWNAHPEGSGVWSGRQDLEGEFAVVDTPRPVMTDGPG